MCLILSDMNEKLKCYIGKNRIKKDAILLHENLIAFEFHDLT